MKVSDYYFRHVTTGMDLMSASYSPDDIFSFLERETGITKVQIKGKSRQGDIMFARHLFSYIAYNCKPNRTYQQVSHILNRNHASVLSGCRVVINNLTVNNRDSERTRTILSKVMNINKIQIIGENN